MQPSAPKEQEVEIERLVRALQEHVDVGIVPEVLRYLTDELEKRTLAERRAAELFRSEQLARTEAREERAANEAKNRFLAVLSHELRTPLQPVLAAASALLRDPRVPADLLDDIRTIQRNVQLEARLIDDLLDLTRIMHGKLALHLTQVNINSVIARAVEICEGETIAKKMRLSVRLNATRTWVLADPGRLQQIMWNLIKNAVKFTPVCGEIVIEAENDAQQKNVIVRVIDNGIGIDADMLPRIFDAFEQADPRITVQFGGLGLGLAISKMLADRHDGTLIATSEGAGKGATFTLTLPCVEAPDPPRLIGGAIKRPAAVKPLRILLVEDDEATAEILGKLLRSIGHDVSVATDCAAAREEAAAEPFELLVCDIALPDGSGLDLLTELKTRCGRSIALTGYGTEGDIQKSLSAGFDCHLTKPVTLGQLVEAIDRLFV